MVGTGAPILHSVPQNRNLRLLFTRWLSFNAALPHLCPTGACQVPARDF